MSSGFLGDSQSSMVIVWATWLLQISWGKAVVSLLHSCPVFSAARASRGCWLRHQTHSCEYNSVNLNSQTRQEGAVLDFFVREVFHRYSGRYNPPCWNRWLTAVLLLTGHLPKPLVKVKGEERLEIYCAAGFYTRSAAKSCSNTTQEFCILLWNALSCSGVGSGPYEKVN